MLIKKKLHDLLVESCPSTPPETGGIIGGRNNIITVYELDKLSGNCSYSSYRPNINYLNDIIREWERNKIEFYGIFHSHYLGGNVLSNPDKEYIQQIMKTVPSTVLKLYFPLIFPQYCIVPYAAEKIEHSIHIIEDVLTFVD